MKKVFLVCGARPNFMKIAPLMREMKKYPNKFDVALIHTGQHYDENMSKVFFEELELPQPNYYLGAGSGRHGEQTARVMESFEKLCIEHKPDLVVVVGDVNSTLAAALTAVKLRIKVAHVEAGLRSFDRDMPEEINRILTDQISDYLFTPSPDANNNLMNEGVSRKNIFFVGNIMADSLLWHIKKAYKSNILERIAYKKKSYALLTLHRPSNVDEKAPLNRIFRALKAISSEISVVFPCHPRTAKHDLLYNGKGVKILPPLGYLDFLSLMMNAKFVLTDSGGIQEETTLLNIPCLTLRETTERPVTITCGTNLLVGNDENKIVRESKKIIEGRQKQAQKIRFWDGKSASRIVKILTR